MARVICKAKVSSVETYQRKKDGSLGCRVVAFDDFGSPIVFYRDASEEPKEGDSYQVIYTYDRNLQPVVRYQKG